MDGGEAGRVRELFLGQREIEHAVLAVTVRFEPEGQLAQQMRDPRAGVAAADIDHPFAEDRRVDQGVDPHRQAHRRPRFRQVENGASRNDRRLAPVEALHIVVGGAEQRVLQIDEFARDVEGNDLAAAVAQQLLPIGKAAQQKRAFAGLLAFADEIVVLAECLMRVGKGLDGVAVVGRQSATFRPPVHERIEVMIVGQ